MKNDLKLPGVLSVSKEIIRVKIIKRLFLFQGNLPRKMWDPFSKVSAHSILIKKFVISFGLCYRDRVKLICLTNIANWYPFTFFPQLLRPKYPRNFHPFSQRTRAYQSLGGLYPGGPDDFWVRLRNFLLDELCLVHSNRVRRLFSKLLP